MRKKTPVSVNTSWPIQGIIAKTSSPFNLVSKFTADRDQSEKKIFLDQNVDTYHQWMLSS